MNWNKWIQQTHRWFSVLFTLALIVNGVAVLRGKYTAALGLAAVAPLALMLITALYLFVLPYAARLPSGRRSG